MRVETIGALKTFISYARKDKTLREELEKHLEVLRRAGQIRTWHDREIQPGAECW
jgi:eukaryotic-like serine/threonine-protein kinase